MLELYERNQTAYQSAMKLMAHAGKAAVIYPTGIGKSLLLLCLLRPICETKSMVKEFGSLHVYPKNKKLDKAS